LAVGAAVGAGQRQMTAWPMLFVRFVDVVLVVIVAPVALALGAPALGYAIGGGAWILQRIIAAHEGRWTLKLQEPRNRLAASLLAGFARIWLLAGAIIIAGVAAGRRDGLTAALVIFGAYSVAFVIRIFSGPPGKRDVPR
jgi:hypothetical protein